MNTSKIEEPRRILYDTLSRKIGGTPLLQLNQISIPNNNIILAKFENENYTGSHYGRVYLDLFFENEFHGMYFKNKVIKKTIVPGITPILENTSGCAGLSCSMIGNALGYETIIVASEMLPQKMKSKIQLSSKKLVETDAELNILGTNQEVKKMLKQFNAGKERGHPSSMYHMNHSQDNRSLIPMNRCGEEIVSQTQQLGFNGIDFFVSAGGNGTSTLGIGNILTNKWKTRIIAFDPAEAPVWADFKSGRKRKKYNFHELRGTGAGLLDFPFLNEALKIIDDVHIVKQNDWEHALRLFIEKEGLYVGHSSAASLFVALSIAQNVQNKIILIVLYDSLDNY